MLNDEEPVELVSEGDLSKAISGHFDLPLGTTGTITFTAVAHWKDRREAPTNKLPPADKCEESTTTTMAPTTTAPPTTAPATPHPPTTVPDSTVAPTTSVEETTTSGVAVGAATSTTAGGGQLPFTGAAPGPMLLAGIALVGGGALVLLAGRIRDRHSTR